MRACKGIAGWLFGHKFEPIFNEEPINPKPLDYLGDLKMTEPCLRALLKSNIRFTYVKSVCVRCGAEDEAS